jgi:hypothetical protein
LARVNQLFGKLHVLAAENAEPQHLRRRELGSELRVEIAPDRRGPQVVLALLHLVVHDDGTSAHFDSLAIFHSRTAVAGSSCGALSGRRPVAI